LATGLTSLSYTTTVGLSPSNSYKFRVYARNSVGLSQAATVTVLCAQPPDTPAAPTTTINGANVVVKWTAPYNGGSTISSYYIVLGQSDGLTYTVDLISCDGSQPAIVTGASCTIPITTFRSSPFNLNWGASVYAKLVASNLVGSSAYSPVGNGAIILTVPDAPLNLVNVPAITNGQQIGL
jgi:hypothetical protein